MPADLTTGRSVAADSAVQRAAAGLVGTALIVGGRNLVLHDRQRVREARPMVERGVGLFACAGEVAGDPVGHCAGLQFDEGLRIAQGLSDRGGLVEQRRHRQRTGEAGRARQRQLEFECDQHGHSSDKRAAGCRLQQAGDHCLVAQRVG